MHTILFSYLATKIEQIDLEKCSQQKNKNTNAFLPELLSDT